MAHDTQPAPPPVTGCDYKLIRGHESQEIADALAADGDYDVFIHAGRVEVA